MMTNQNDAVAGKRDLHVGGLGARSSPGNAMVSEPPLDAAEQLLRSVQKLFRSAEDYIHDNPWAAVGVVGVIGLAAGYFLSRRD